MVPVTADPDVVGQADRIVLPRCGGLCRLHEQVGGNSGT